MKRNVFPTVIVLVSGLALPLSGQSQNAPDDTDWYRPDRPHLKLNVVEDGIFHISMNELAAFIPAGSVDASTLRLFEHGKEVPIDYHGVGGPIASQDYFLFVGRRNTGLDETWAYHYDASLQPDSSFSIYTDTTTYFLTWGYESGLRYVEPAPVPPSPDTVFTFKAVGRFHRVRSYYFGIPGESGHPLYTHGEGWMSLNYNHTDDGIQSIKWKIPLRRLPRTSEDTLRLKALLVGASGTRHVTKLSARLDINENNQNKNVVVDSLDWSGYPFVTLKANIPQSEVLGEKDGTLSIAIISDNTHNSIPNSIYFHHASAEFTAVLSTDDGPLSFVAERGGPLVYQFSSEGDAEIVVLKPGTRDLFTLTADGSFNDMTTQGDMFWASSIEDLKKPSVARDTPSDLANPSAAYDYVIVSAPGLMISAGALKTYRESPEGGGYTVLLANVQDVFDQFDYGRRTPIAISRFIEHSRSWEVVPEFFTFWGDALYPDPKRQRFDWEVPSFGHASSDGWFAMFANGDLQDYTESVALGRLPVRTNEQGNQFVEKLVLYESTPLGDWHKQITLMAGGVTSFEQGLLHGVTRAWGDQISSGAFGGDVTFFLKSESTALDPTFLDSVDAAIARGTSWLAFFGHSAADSWEIVTTPPPRFDNAGFLPMAISLGCFTGAFARGTGQPTDNPVYAELLVTESSNGAIAHFGGSTSSLISTASALGQALYDEVFEHDERIIGHAVRAAKKAYLEKTGLSSRSIETAMQYNLIGDPATRLRLPTKPDFDIEPRSISIGPTTPVAGLDSVLTVTVEIKNRGKVPGDSVTISLSHVSPTNVRTNYSARLGRFPLIATTDFRIPISEKDVGGHRFELTIDSDFEFEEEFETNNRAEKTHTVFASGVIQLFPLNFGIVTNRQPILQIGAASFSGKELAVFVELDTVATFDSPGVVRDRILVSSISDWKPLVTLVNSRSYFWRIRVDDPALETSWSSSSFTVREDLSASGWLQQGPQFAGNQHGRFLEYTNNQWKFKQFDVKILLRSRVAFGLPLANAITVAGTQYNRIKDGFGVVILDSHGNVKDRGFDSFVLYSHKDNKYDPSVEIARLDSLLSTAQTGEYILVNTYLVRQVDDAEGIFEEAKQLFRDLGSTGIDNIDFLDTWNFVTRLGQPEPIIDRWVNYVPDVTDLNQTDELTLFVNFGASETVSPLIGPATSWERLEWSAIVEAEGATIDVVIMSLDGDTLTESTVEQPGGTQRIDLSSGPFAIDADDHPFLRLSAWFQDASLTETPQLLDWSVGFELVAELSLLASGLQTDPDTLAEGDVYFPSVTVVNAAGGAVDSVFVSYDVTDANNVTSRVAVDTLLDVLPNTSLESSARVETFGFVGKNQITVVVRQSNPHEPIPYNNTAIGYFFVVGDSEPPLFRVTIDGVDYPSDPRVINSTDDPTLPFLGSTPVIEITVTDENQFHPLSDSSVITILLDGDRIGYNRSDIVFEPGDTDNNEARLTFLPNFTGQDTTHTMKIYAQDVAGNANPSKEDPYTFSFRVQAEAEVESLYPYPNPMNNFTTFMFKLRGADPSLVEDFRIRIYTISGRTVREFDLVRDPFHLEAGGLQIGWNRVPWDGTDEDGDIMGNGVYLYKVFLRAEGKEMVVNNESGIEKIAIVR